MTTRNDDERPAAADPSATAQTPAAEPTGERTEESTEHTEEPTEHTEESAEESAERTEEPTEERTEAPTEESASAPHTAAVQSPDRPLLAGEAAMDFRARWEAIQQGFVDDPKASVTDADNLVDEVLQRLSDSFDEQHRELERQWSEGEPSTEDLRGALQRYRDFFQRLLTI